MLITHTLVRRHPLWQKESQRCLSVREHLVRARGRTRRQRLIATIVAMLGVLLGALR